MAGVSKYSENDITLISITLAKDIFREYSNYTMEEINFCFDNGVKGKYGDYYGVNIRALLYWLEKYKTSDIRQQVRKRIQEEEQQKALSADNSLSSADRDMQYAREAFRRYKNGENLEMLRPPYIYKTLQTVELSITPVSRNWKPWNVSRISNRPEGLISRNMLASISFSSYGMAADAGV